MSTKIFVALTFQEGHSFTKKIQQFRQRFDTKFTTNKYLHLGIVPPFEIDDHDILELGDTLVEELETFFFNLPEARQLSFQDIKVHDFKKNKLLFLEPQSDPDLEYVQELLQNICQDYVKESQHSIAKTPPFLTIARSHDDLALQNAFETARIEFREDVMLPWRSISLFKKNHADWLEERELCLFPRLEDHFYNPS
jgi:2'-5' RNA ligase